MTEDRIEDVATMIIALAEDLDHTPEEVLECLTGVCISEEDAGDVSIHLS